MVEIPSYAAGLIAFGFMFLLTGVMFLILREERDKSIPPLNPLGPTDVVKFENPLSSSDAPYLAIITLVAVELVLNALVVVGVLQGMGSIAIGTMLALAAFIAAALLGVYRSAFMSEAFTRKPRLETIATRAFGRVREVNADE